MKKPESFDFWYAVSNTEVVLLPKSQLETFGSTILNYHLVSELMDRTDQVRVREGRLQASRPQIVTPTAYSQVLLEGFGEEADKYAQWLRDHEHDIRILQYGYRLKQESFSEHILSDNVQAVVERVKKAVVEKEDPYGAVVLGVDDPWDVCLIKLFREVIIRSAHTNLKEMTRHHLFDEIDGVPKGVRDEIEQFFRAAAKDAALINPLHRKLQQHNLFEQYQDRFFALVKTRKR